MSEISTAGAIANTLVNSKLPDLPRVELPSKTISNGDTDYTVSAEAQYLFDMQRFLSGLDEVEQTKAMDFLANSAEPLHNKAAADFNRWQSWLKTNGPIQIDQSSYDRKKNEDLLAVPVEVNEFTEIAFYPNPTGVYRLDGKADHIMTTGLGNDNQEFIQQLDALERTMEGTIGNQNRANLFGAVKLALIDSGNFFLSADDAIHFNYSLEKARKTIEFVQPPEHIKTALTSLLHKGVLFQESEQAKAVEKDRKLINNPRVGHLAAESVRLGTAAQEFHRQLYSTLASSDLSLLNSGSLIPRMLLEHQDLIRFDISKVQDALDYYRNDYAAYEKALNKDFSVPEVKYEDPLFDNAILEAGQQYAQGVIQDIKRVGLPMK